MKLIPYDIDKLEGRSYYKKSENFRILEEFTNSDMECAKIEDFSQASAMHCVSSLKGSIKRYRFSGVAAMVRKGEAYLIKVKD